MISEERHADYERRLGWVADVCQIPPENRRGFLAELVVGLRDAGRTFARVQEIEGVPRKGALVKKLRGWRRTRGRPYLEPIEGDRVSEAAVNLLVNFVPGGADLSVFINSATKADRDALFERAIDHVIADRPGIYPERGRSTGTTGRVDLDQFVKCLFYSALALGGTPPTASRFGTDDAKGPFVEMLNKLVADGELPERFLAGISQWSLVDLPRRTLAESK